MMGHGGEVLLAFQGFLALAESSLGSEKDWSKIVRVQICPCAFFPPTGFDSCPVGIGVVILSGTM